MTVSDTGAEAVTPRTGGSRRRRRPFAVAVPFLLPYLALFTVFLAWPLVYGFYLSLHDWHLLSPEKRFVGFSNYAGVIRDDLFHRAVLNTLVFVALSVPLGNLASLLIALGLNSRPKGETLFKVGFYLPTVLSVAVVTVLWRWIYNAEFGLLNHYMSQGHELARSVGITSEPWKPIPWLGSPQYSMSSLVMMSVWWGAGGGMLIYLAGLRAIPESYYEAAEVDGATPWRRFWAITWPLLRPTTLFNVVVGLIGAFQMFGQVFMMTQGGPHWSTLTVVYYMYQTGFSLFKMGYGSAVAYTLFLIILVVTVIQFRLLAYREEIS
jgi:multiple sugar transport system permease protein